MSKSIFSRLKQKQVNKPIVRFDPDDESVYGCFICLPFGRKVNFAFRFLSSWRRTCCLAAAVAAKADLFVDRADVVRQTKCGDSRYPLYFRNFTFHPMGRPVFCPDATANDAEFDFGFPPEGQEAGPH